MKDIRVRLCMSALFCAGLLCQALAAQEPSGKAPAKDAPDPRTTTRLTLGSTSGTPGDAVVVPIYYTPAEGAQVGRLKISVNFVSANLKFDKLERGIAAEMGNVEVKSDLQVSKNDKGVETSTLLIEAAAPASPKGPIPAGLLAYVSMKINESGRPATIALRTTA